MKNQPEIKIARLGYAGAGQMYIKLGESAFPLRKYSVAASDTECTELTVTIRVGANKIRIEPEPDFTETN